MKDRIDQLESLVLELMHQIESSPRKQSLYSLETISTNLGFQISKMSSLLLADLSDLESLRSQ
jgi:hypothetical protein